MYPWLRLLRPGNALLAAIAVAAAGLIAVGPGELAGVATNLAVAMVAVTLCVGGGNALNDYYDRVSDERNHPRRPLPAGEISPTTALWLARGLLLAGVATAALINPLTLVIATAAVLLLLAYERWLKARGASGNLIVAALAGGLFLFGGTATGESPGPTLALAALAFLGMLSRELVKDVEDLAGDTDRRTLPARIGPAATLWLALGVMLAGALLSLMAVRLFASPGWMIYLTLIVAAGATMVGGVWVALRGDAADGQRWLKRGMALALLAFVGGAAVR